MCPNHFHHIIISNPNLPLPNERNAKNYDRLQKFNILVREILYYYLFLDLLVAAAAESSSVVDTAEKVILPAQEV